MNEESNSLDGSSVTLSCKKETKSESMILRSDGSKEIILPSSESRIFGVGGESSDAQYWLKSCSVG